METLSFLADFVSEEVMQEFFGYQQHQTSDTFSTSSSGGVVEMAIIGGKTAPRLKSDGRNQLERLT